MGVTGSDKRQGDFTPASGDFTPASLGTAVQRVKVFSQRCAAPGHSADPRFFLGTRVFQNIHHHPGTSSFLQDHCISTAPFGCWSDTSHIIQSPCKPLHVGLLYALPFPTPCYSVLELSEEPQPSEHIPAGEGIQQTRTHVCTHFPSGQACCSENKLTN